LKEKLVRSRQLHRTLNVTPFTRNIENTQSCIAIPIPVWCSAYAKGESTVFIYHVIVGAAIMLLNLEPEVVKHQNNNKEPNKNADQCMIQQCYSQPLVGSCYCQSYS
jgi:hypothetical protein